jgi:FtsZ-interacting cell division protein ZipA
MDADLRSLAPIIVATAVAAIIALVGLWANRKLGLNAATGALVSTLKDTLDAATKRIALLEAENADLYERISYLEQQATDFKNEIRILRIHLQEKDPDA